VTAGLLAWGGCARRDVPADKNTSPDAEHIAREVEATILAPEASSLSRKVIQSRSCVVGREWTFVIPWTQARYTAWLKDRMAPEFAEVSRSEKVYAFSRYVQGDAHSVTIAMTGAGDSVQVRANLCVFPD
jgi:hypothetical protein